MHRPCRVRICCSIVACCSLAGAFTAPLAAEPRPAWTTSKLTGTPEPPPPYKIELAFPKLKFDHPLDLVPAPGSDRLFVAEQGGRIYSFENTPQTEKADLFADFKQIHPEITAVYSLIFHPQFEQNRFVYVCYVQGANQPDGSFVSRFRVTNTNPPTIDPGSELVLIRWWAGGHNGCSLKFGPDGFLYISTGDGGDPAPPDPLHAGQDVSNLLSAILRIDVDHQDGNQNYRVPPDNPLIGIDGARPEIWAYGFRNPWRMSFDRAGGDLWVGDVGWQLWEMIYRVERGGNYGWAIMEGPQPVLPETKQGPTPILPPTVAHPHSEASSITGGYVYHGKLLPELAGVYVYGDFQTGTVWGLKYDGKQVTWHKELARTPLQLVSFGEDRAGELYLVDYERSHQIYRLVPNPNDGRHASFPRKLSETGLFSDTASQTPAPGVLRYEINTTHWADFTTSERWMALPGNSPVQVDANGNWQFPEGAVLAKTVSLEMDTGKPRSTRRLETQILQREDGSWRPYTYVWNDSQTDAELLEAAGATRVLKVADANAPGGVREQSYRFASRAECQTCHNPWVEKKTTIYGVQSASPLALSAAQWNRSVQVAGKQENQVSRLVREGWLPETIVASLEKGPKFVDPYDPSADLELRARSYLHVNCAHCHQPHAGGTATIELTNDVKLADAKLMGVRPSQGTFGIAHASLITPGDPLGSVLHYRIAKTGGGRMPRLGSEEVDERGVALIREWITRLPPAASTVAAASSPPSPEMQRAVEGVQSTNPAERSRALQELTSSTRGALTLLQLVQSEKLSGAARSEAVSLAAAHAQPEVRDLFERFLPASKRLKRLGTSINVADLLALKGDAESGRKLFFRDAAASCKSCHRVGNQGETLGPELSQIGKKYPPAEMLSHLLEPSKFMEPKYVPQVLETKAGKIYSGLLVERSESEVILRTAQNEQVKVAATDIESLVPQQKSLMPELLLRDLTPQQAADLLAYLTSLK